MAMLSTTHISIADAKADLLIGAGFRGSILWFARAILSDAEEESTPEFIGEAGKVATTVGSLL